PFTGVVVPAVRWVWTQEANPAIRFLWSWFLPGFIIFSLVTTKLPHYIAPLLPAMALMIGLWLTEIANGRARLSRGWLRGGAIVTVATGALMAIGLPVGAWLAELNALLFPALVVSAILLGFSVWGGLRLL